MIKVLKIKDTQKIIGTFTILKETKLIHNFGKVAHIEDVVIDKSMRNLGLGHFLINQAKIEMNPNIREKLLQDIVADLHKQGAALWLIEFSRIVAFRDSINIGKFRLDGTMFEKIQKKTN